MSGLGNIVRVAFLGAIASFLMIAEGYATLITGSPQSNGAEIIDCSIFAPPDFSGCNPDGVGDVLFVGGSAVILTPQVEARSIAKFNMLLFTNAGVTAGSLTSAIFQVTNVRIASACGELDPCPEPTTLSIGRFAAADGTYVLADYAAGADFVGLPVPAIGSSVDLNVTGFVRALMTNGDPFAGFNVRLINDFGSFAPLMRLAVSDEPLAVPEPAALLLFGVGLAVLGFMRQRRKAT